jgi:YidC/Oxa1 family membrane protein insertase
MRKDGRYLPAGIYDAERGVFRALDQIAGIGEGIAVQRTIDAPISSEGENFYVLQNQYQQLVFSDIGAALLEINIPFTDTEVRSIAIDNKIQEQSPANSAFPLLPYLTPGAQPQGPFVEQTELAKEGYYPLLRRTQIRRGKIDPIEVQHRSLNIVSSYPEVAQLRYAVKSFEKDRIVFEAKQRHRRITKTFTLPQGLQALPHVIDVEIAVEGDSRGLWLTTGLPEAELVSGRAAPAVKVRQTRAGRGEVESLRLPKDALTVSSFNPDWLCSSNGFFGVIIDPLTKVDAGYMVQLVAGQEAPTRLALVDSHLQRHKATDYPAYNALLPLSTNGGVMKFRVYTGPLAGTTLKAVDKAILESTGKNPDYASAQSYHGWFSWVSEPVAKILFFLMRFFYSFTHSWGFSIILLTVFVRVLLFPLNAWSMRSMRKTQKLSPLVQQIQKKYKKDPKRMQMEIMNLYREHKANPMGGCLPMIIQMPFLIGMFDLLRSAFELRGAPFIPGWIDDLASPDVLFQWSTPLPLIGTEFHLLPLIVGGVMYLQSKVMSSPPADPDNLTDAERQQKMMTTIMPGMMTVLFYNFAAGLNIYMLSSTLLGVIQQWYTNRLVDKEQVAPPPSGGKNKQGKGKKAQRTGA